MAKTKGQLFSKIDYLFVDIQSQYSEIKKSSEIDLVDVTLLEANLAALTKHFEALKIKTQLAQSANFQQEISNKTIFTPATEVSKPADDTQEVFEEIEEELPKVDVPKEETTQAEFAFNINEVNHNAILPKEEDPVASVDEVVEILEEEEEIVAPVAEEPSTRPLSINELIKQQKQAGVNVTQQFQTSTANEKVLDLKNAVSLNDKLLYIKDLFNGYSLAYSEAIELLNRFDSFAEADAFLQSNYAVKNGWAEKSQTVEKFYNLLQRKFNV